MDVLVVDESASPRPVENVVVRVFDEKNTRLVSEDTTDADGRVGFTLWPQNYNLRFYKFGAQIKQPQALQVLDADPPTPQEFQVSARVFVHPSAVDPRLCRVSGFFRTVSGEPNPGVDLHFMGQFQPVVLDGAAVLDDKRIIRTDQEGFACVDLIRGAMYDVYGQGFEDAPRCIRVPDQPSANLPDVLFAVVREVSFDVATPLSLTLGQSLTLTPTVVDSGGAVLTGTGVADVQWTSSDPSVVTLAVTPTELELRAVSRGSAELRARRRDESIIHIPDDSIQGVPQVIIVA